MTRPLIGLIGRKRVGKDTVAARLVGRHGFVRYAFADRVRDAALALDPIVIPGDPEWTSVRLFELVVREGWEAAKDRHEVRRVLQNFGTGIRELDPDFWVRPVMAAITEDPRPAVVTDVRFPNEAQAIRDAGGALVRIGRPGLDESDSHVSEVALAYHPVDLALINDGTVEQLADKVDRLLPLTER